MYRLPLSIYRSGTSRGLLFLASDLESVPRSGLDVVAAKACHSKEKNRDGKEQEPVDYRDLVAARCVGSGHVYGVEGLGGGRSSTSKSLWIRKSLSESLDVELKFVQAEIAEFGVDNSHGDCGNMLASVGPFALEKGLVEAATFPVTTVKLRSLNSNTRYEIDVQTEKVDQDQDQNQNQKLAVKPVYSGTHRISGITDAAAPVKVSAFGMTGTLGRGLLPTGNAIDTVEVEGCPPVRVSCVDFSRPMVFVDATDVNMTGEETKLECDKNEDLNRRMDQIRREAALLMGMGDVTGKTSPKIAALSRPKDSKQTISTRYFTAPYNQDLHYALAMTAAQCISSACLAKGTIANELCQQPKPSHRKKKEGEGEGGGEMYSYDISIGHPSGVAEISIEVNHDQLEDSSRMFHSASYIRTVRPIMAGEFFFPLE